MKQASKADMSTLILAAIGGLLAALLLSGCACPACGLGGGKSAGGSGCGPGGCPRGKSAESRISTGGLKTLIAAGTPMVIIDARTGKYDDGRRIPGAGNLAADASTEEVGKVIKSKDQLIVTYCSNLKCPASGMLAEHLRKMGYKNVVEYPFGIQGWVADGNATEKAGK